MIRYSYLLLQPLSKMGSRDDIRRTLDLAKACGYQGVELNLIPADLDLLPELEGWLQDSGLVLPSFCTGEAYAEGLCLSSPTSSVRRQATERLIDYLDAAEQFGAVLVVGLMQGTLNDEPDPAVANARIIHSLQEVGVAAEAKGVELVIEPVNHLQVGFNNTVAEVRGLIQAIGSPVFKPMIDTVHLNIEERSLTQPIYDCGPELRHVHLCENNGGLYGTGHIDFAAILKALEDIEYDYFGSVKVYRRAALDEAMRSSIVALRRAAP